MEDLHLAVKLCIGHNHLYSLFLYYRYTYRYIAPLHIFNSLWTFFIAALFKPKYLKDTHPKWELRKRHCNICLIYLFFINFHRRFIRIILSYLLNLLTCYLCSIMIIVFSIRNINHFIFNEIYCKVQSFVHFILSSSYS